MPQWTKPSEGMPDEHDVGDRVAIIVRERPYAGARLRNRLVLLESTEDGWKAVDDTYAGYTPLDGICWSYEKSICGIADAIMPLGSFDHRERLQSEADAVEPPN